LAETAGRTERRDGALDKGGDLVFVGHVADDTEHVVACGGEIVGRGPQRFLVDVGERDAGALLTSAAAIVRIRSPRATWARAGRRDALAQDGLPVVPGMPDLFPGERDSMDAVGSPIRHYRRKVSELADPGVLSRGVGQAQDWPIPNRLDDPLLGLGYEQLTK
jgi:hypothetical protein